MTEVPAEGMHVPVRDQATPAPATVTKFSEGALMVPKKPRRRKKKTSKVTTRKIDPRLLKEAMRMADGDASRLVINYEEQSIVVKNPKK